MSDKLVFVQFPHPGSEHKPDGREMGWNRDPHAPHARKFLTGQGHYLADGAMHLGAFTFWGEWEPQSSVIKTFPKAGPG